MSFRAITWAYECKLPCVKKFLLVTLCDAARVENNACIISQATLARKCDLTRSYVNRLLGELERDGYIEIEARLTKNGGCGSSRYVIKAPLDNGEPPVYGSDESIAPPVNVIAKTPVYDVQGRYTEPGFLLTGISESPDGDSSKRARDDVPGQMVAVWNQVCGHIHRADKIDSGRSKKLRDRLKDSFGGSMDQWRPYCERVARSAFLSGAKTDWRTSLDWVLEPKNLRNITEGKYDDRDHSSRRASGAEQDTQGGRRGPTSVVAVYNRLRAARGDG